MPGSVGSPNSELAIAYVQCGQSPRPEMTCPFRHSGAETIFLGSVMPSDRLLPAVRAAATGNGAGVLLVEQHVHLALKIADRGYILSHGELAASGSAEQLSKDSALLAASYLGSAADSGLCRYSAVSAALQRGQAQWREIVQGAAGPRRYGGNSDDQPSHPCGAGARAGQPDQAGPADEATGATRA